MATGDSQRASQLLNKLENGDFDKHSDINSVINLLRSKEPTARKRAARCFAKLAKKYPINIRNRKSYVLKRLEDEDAAVRAEALSALNKIAEECPDSIREDISDITNMVKDDSLLVKNEALTTTLTVAEEYPEDVRERAPELLEALQTGDGATHKLAAKTIVQITDESDIGVLEEAAEIVDGNSERIISRRINEIQDDDGGSGSGSDRDGASEPSDQTRDSDKLAYKEASSIELPEDYEFREEVNQSDYFELSLKPGYEGVRITLRLSGEERRHQSYCRAISKGKVYVPVSIFAALGLHDSRIEWIGSDEKEKMVWGELRRPSMQPEVPEQDRIRSSQLNPSNEGFDVKLDFDEGHKPEAMYLDIAEIEDSLCVSATPVELDDAARDLPNVATNTGQAEDTLQFRVPIPISQALSLNSETEFSWFIHEESLFLIFADEDSTAEKNILDTEEKKQTEPEDHEKSSGSPQEKVTEPKEYEDIDSLLADIEHKTLPSQREVIKRKIENPDLDSERIVESPKIELTEDAVKETLEEYEDVIQSFSDSDTEGESKAEEAEEAEEGDDISNKNDRGGQPSGKTERDGTKQRLLNAIEEVGEKLGKRPTIDDIEEMTPYGQNDYYGEFESWTAALKEVGYEYEPHNTKKTKTDEDPEVTERTVQETGTERILDFSGGDIKIKETVEKPLLGGGKEITLEELDSETLPLEDLSISVTAVEVEEGNSIRLHFGRDSEADSETRYLLYFTADGTELRELRDKVFGEGQKEVTIENISWEQDLTRGIDMRVSGIKLHKNDPSMPVLELRSINKKESSG